MQQTVAAPPQELRTPASTNGGLVTTNRCARPLTSTCTSSPSDTGAARRASATPILLVGEKVPDVTVPTASCATETVIPKVSQTLDQVKDTAVTAKNTSTYVAEGVVTPLPGGDHAPVHVQDGVQFAAIEEHLGGGRGAARRGRVKAHATEGSPCKDALI